MFIKRVLLIAVAAALAAGAIGCRHHCCHREAVSYAPSCPPPCP